MTIWWASHRSVCRPPAWVAAIVRSRAVEKYVGVEVAGGGVDGGGVQQVAVFGDEQHDQPVGDAQQRAVQVVVGVADAARVSRSAVLSGWETNPVPRCCSAAATPCCRASSARAPSSMAVVRQISELVAVFGRDGAAGRRGTAAHRRRGAGQRDWRRRRHL